VDCGPPAPIQTPHAQRARPQRALLALNISGIENVALRNKSQSFSEMKGSYAEEDGGSGGFQSLLGGRSK
jgi:hypothetical protein